MKLKSVATTALALATTIAALAGSTTAGAGSIQSATPQSITPTQQLTSTNTAQPVRGDFDGDGADDIFWYVPGSGADFLWSGKGRDTSVGDATADRFHVGQLAISGTYTPLVGDYDGNGKDDIFWYGPGVAPDSMWAFTARGTFTSYSTAVNGKYTPVVGNFNTTGTSAGSDDIFLYSGLATGSVLLSGTSTMGSFTSRSYPAPASTPAGAKVYAGNWRQASTSPGATVHQDLLFYVPGTTADSIWVGDGTGAFTTSSVAINGSYDLIIGDFDLSTGPSMTDIFWYAPGTKPDSVWMNNGSGFASIAQTVNATTYKPVVLKARGALDQDDILWNNPTGNDFIWRTSGTNGSFAYTSLTPSSLGATDQGTRTPLTGDFDYAAPTAGLKTTTLAPGHDHACAITTAGAATCWGSNSVGQVGNGTTTNTNTPGTVFGLTSGVTSISSGAFSSCAVVAGAAKCWGINDTNQLGRGSTVGDTTKPANVSGLSTGIASIAAGPNHACAITDLGAVKCWGANAYGQLGNGGTTGTNAPVDVTGLAEAATAIAIGAEHTCALTTSGGVKCWGRNLYGQLGRGNTTNSSAPVDVTGLTSGVTSLDAGRNHNCAVDSTGAAKCWGRNDFGQLGNNTTTQATSPITPQNQGSNVKSVGLGFDQSCLTTIFGQLFCAGSNGGGALGINSTTNSSTFVSLGGLGSGSQIAGGFNHTCAADSSGVYCWGTNDLGRTGLGLSSGNTLTPAIISGLLVPAPGATTSSPGNPENVDVLWWALGNTAAQTEQLWLELGNL